MIPKIVSYEEFKHYRKTIHKKKIRFKIKRLLFIKRKLFIALFTFLIAFPCILYFFTETPELISLHLNSTKDVGKIISGENINILNKNIACSYIVKLNNGSNKNLKVVHKIKKGTYSLNEKIFIFTKQNKSYYVYSSKEMYRILIVIPLRILLILLLPLILIYKKINLKKSVST